MAQMIPDSPVPGCSAAEERVFRALSTMSGEWRCFHSVAWQGRRNGRQGDGEADFVLLHPQHGLIVLEVKGGGIALDQGRWWSTDRFGQRHEIKNPFLQATSSKHALQAHIKAVYPAFPPLGIGHAVWLPDLANVGRLDLTAQAQTTLGREDLSSPEQAIKRVVEHWSMTSELQKQHIEAIAGLIAPTVSFRPLLRDQVDEALIGLQRLTDEQIRTLVGIRRNRRAIILGGAGTGKTVLAIEQAKRLAAEGFRTLLTCYNRPLGDYLGERMKDYPKVRATSFHALCRAMVERASLETPPSADRQWWEESLPELLPDAAEALDESFDAVVIDEGQDFRSSWFTSLLLLLQDPSDGPVYVFADEKQAIYVEDWEPPFDGPYFDLTINCRNTSPIATAVGRVFGDASANLGVDGPSVEMLGADAANERQDALRRALHRLVADELISPDRIVVLSPSRTEVDKLRSAKIAGLELAEAGGPRRVRVETVHRFKGLEADAAVVLLDGDEGPRDRALQYIALSRARAHLTVIGPRRLIQSLA